MKMPYLVENFKIPPKPFKPPKIPSKEELRKFYNALSTLRDKALFLLYASSGLRSSEVLSLKLENIDFKKHMITPQNHEGRSKHAWISFFNEEAEQALKNYLLLFKFYDLPFCIP